MKTSELSGAELDAWVAKAEGRPHWVGGRDGPEYFSPSTDWAQGGPIIEREGISVEFEPSADGKEQWLAQTCMRDAQFANTPLIAAMRCYVALKLGN